ncbi:Ubiquinone biosynthesis protein coq9, mitochondrial [Pseudogymnoascus australis]
MATSLRLLRLRPRTTAPLPSLTTRTYHSHNHPPPPGPFNAIETHILSSSLPHIPHHGFTPTSLHLGAQDAGYLDASTNLFPSGAFSLVRYHLYTQRQALASRSDILNPAVDASSKTKPPGVGAKVKALTWARLQANADVVHKLPEALALMSLFGNIRPSLHELHLLSDEIWYLAGDVSVDSSWYTKRASLGAVYAASEVFMSTDTSEGFRETREFLERRFEDSRVVGEGVGSVGEWVGFQAGAVVNLLRSKGVRI